MLCSETEKIKENEVKQKHVQEAIKTERIDIGPISFQSWKIISTWDDVSGHQSVYKYMEITVTILRTGEWIREKGRIGGRAAQFIREPRTRAEAQNPGQDLGYISWEDHYELECASESRFPRLSLEASNLWRHLGDWICRRGRTNGHRLAGSFA